MERRAEPETAGKEMRGLPPVRVRLPVVCDKRGSESEKTGISQIGYARELY